MTKQKGMHCPTCGVPTRVYDTRHSDGNNQSCIPVPEGVVRRWRTCVHGHKIKTEERVVTEFKER